MPHSTKNDVLPGRKADLVIFDKDGTLICFGAGWTEWTKNAVDALTRKLQKPVSGELYSLLGYNKEEDRWREGLLCDLNQNIIDGLTDFLIKHGMPKEKASKTVMDHYTANDKTGLGIDKIHPLDNPRSIMEKLKTYGVKIAVCTADNTAGCEIMMDELKLNGLVDFTLCCDKEEMRPKPSPENIHLICERLGVDPKKAVMVGDSLRDVQMGQRAGVMASVGVLSGVGCAEHLKSADYVVPSIKHVLDLVLPQGYEEASINRLNMQVSVAATNH